MKTSNGKAGMYVFNKIPFTANNLKAKTVGNCYVVFSYDWYPVFVYTKGKWYENDNTYSKSTAKQMGQCRPEEAIKLPTEKLEDLYK